MFGPTTSSVVEVPCVLYMGQSNMDGCGQSERLANTLWNYKGILAGWPATRVAQPQYVAAPAGVHIYDKLAAQGADLMLDNGVWEPYVAGVNSRNVAGPASPALVMFGTECMLSQCIADHTGGDVAIIKPAFAGVGLLPTTLNTPPGPFNYIARTIAMLAYVKRATETWAAYQPGTRLKLVGVVWWQGESDANVGVTGAAYVTALTNLYNFFNAALQSYFVMTRAPVWNFVALDYYRTPAETDINSSVQAFAAAQGQYFIDAHVGKSLQKQELTVAQASPLAKGAPTNASGNDDNEHSNYIAHELVSESAMNNFIAAGAL